LADADAVKKPSKRVFKTSLPKVSDLLSGIAPDLNLTISIDASEKEWIEEMGKGIKEQVQETSDRVDHRWKVTQWLFAAVLTVNIISLLLTN
jgi:hypothetical protein